MPRNREQLARQLEELREAMEDSGDSIEDLAGSLRDAQQETSSLAGTIETAVTRFLENSVQRDRSTEGAAVLNLAGLVASANILKSIEDDKTNAPILRLLLAEQTAICASLNGGSFTIPYLKSAVRYFARIRGRELDELIDDWCMLEFIVEVEDNQSAEVRPSEAAVEGDKDEKEVFYAVDRDSGVYRSHLAKPMQYPWMKIANHATLEEFYAHLEGPVSDAEELDSER